LIMQDPVASSLYGLEQRHALLDDVFESMGVSDTSKYMMRPDSPEFQQKQMQEQQMQQQMQEMQMQIQQFQMQLQEQQVQQGWAVINNDMMDKMEDNQRADTELSVETRQGDRELDIKARKGAA
jgi:hypothetical protein